MNKFSKVLYLKIPLHKLFKDGNGYEWKQNDQELIIDGVYHEILKVRPAGDSALVSVIADQSENNLFNAFFTFNDDMNGDGPGALNLLDFKYICCVFGFRHVPVPETIHQRPKYSFRLPAPITPDIFRPPLPPA
jgi:hypothetical protein